MGKRAKHNKKVLQGRRKKTKFNPKTLKTNCSNLHQVAYGTEQERKLDYNARHLRSRDLSKRLLSENVPVRTIRKRKIYKVFDNK